MIDKGRFFESLYNLTSMKQVISLLVIMSLTVVLYGQKSNEYAPGFAELDYSDKKIYHGFALRIVFLKTAISSVVILSKRYQVR